MYMYLSDRIRRMFLSGACPQNISPKKSLSLKDQRFLQKNVAEKNLNRILVKQQKLLYEKHMGLYVQEKKATINSNKQPFFYKDKTKSKANNYYFSKNSMGLFVLNIKVQKEKKEGLFHENKKKNLNKALQSFVFLDKSRILNIGKTFNHAKQTKYGMPSNDHADTLFKNVTHTKPFFFKDESSYTNCRYLYDHESLKTCIVPQIFKNQKPLSRHKTLLHERKKIALLYGQLAKKDIINISKKALNTPGFFEDNMFTLLESRVDVCVFRAGFSKTIAGARQLIRNGSILVNGQKVYSCKRKAKPGDYFSFTEKQRLLNPYRSTTLELYHLCLSSNFLGQWLFCNKKVFLWQLSFKNEYPLTVLNKKKNNRLLSVPDWLLLLFFLVPSKKNYKPGFCSSFYWGFFLYKLKKMPFFSYFFEPKKKTNKGFNFFEKYSFNGTVTCPLIVKNEKAKKLGHKGMAEKALPLETLLGRNFSGGELQEKSKKNFETKQIIKGIVINGQSAGLKKACTLQTKPYLLWLPIKTSMAWLTCIKQGFTFEKKNKKFCLKQLAFIKKKSGVLLNLYTQLLLKKQEKKDPCSNFAPCRGFSGNLDKVGSMVPVHCNPVINTGHAKQGQAGGQQFFFRKKVSSSHLWAIWGQKPLHLEISHKTGAFIYMYKPQKIISPVCLNFKP